MPFGRYLESPLKLIFPNSQVYLYHIHSEKNFSNFILKGFRSYKIDCSSLRKVTYTKLWNYFLDYLFDIIANFNWFIFPSFSESLSASCFQSISKIHQNRNNFLFKKESNTNRLESNNRNMDISRIQKISSQQRIPKMSKEHFLHRSNSMSWVVTSNSLCIRLGDEITLHLPIYLMAFYGF